MTNVTGLNQTNSPVHDGTLVPAAENCGLCAHCGEPIPIHPVYHTWVSSDPEGLIRYHIDRPECRIAFGDPMPGTRMPNVMGLDLSMTATGVCVPSGETLTVQTNVKHGDRRLAVIRDAVRIWIEASSPDLAVLEEAPPGLKGPAIKAIHMVQGVVRMALLDSGVPYAVVNPSTLKVYATGKKGADKTAMAMAAYKRARLEFGDDNQCDAWWLRAMGMDHLEQALFPLPATQRVHLNAVDWPQLKEPASGSDS